MSGLKLEMSGVSRRHHPFLKGIIRPAAKAEEDLRAATRSEVEAEAHEEQTATSRLPGERYLMGRHRHDPEKIKSVET